MDNNVTTPLTSSYRERKTTLRVVKMDNCDPDLSFTER